jgi:hypothetical protein
MDELGTDRYVIIVEVRSGVAAEVIVLCEAFEGLRKTCPGQRRRFQKEGGRERERERELAAGQLKLQQITDIFN